jgi:hypothetical protein
LDEGGESMLRNYRIEFTLRSCGQVYITAYNKDEALEKFNDMDPEDKLMPEVEFSELKEYEIEEDYPEE